MERPHGREFQAVSSAPIKKLPASPRVSLSRVAMKLGWEWNSAVVAAREALAW